MMMWAGLAMVMALSAAPPADVSECGLDNPVASDFSLMDRNPGSPTAGNTFSRGDYAGQVMLIYWATAT